MMKLGQKLILKINSYNTTNLSLKKGLEVTTLPNLFVSYVFHLLLSVL